MANEESNGLEKQNLSLYADVRERLLQKMKLYPTQEDWIYYQAQSVVTKVQDQIPWDARMSRERGHARKQNGTANIIRFASVFSIGYRWDIRYQ